MEGVFQDPPFIDVDQDEAGAIPDDTRDDEKRTQLPVSSHGDELGFALFPSYPDLETHPCLIEKEERHCGVEQAMGYFGSVYEEFGHYGQKLIP